MINNSVIQGLNSAKNTPDIFAYLVDNKNQSVFTFLFNPEEKSFSRQVKLDEGVTALTSTPSQFYKYTTGLTLQLPNLLLETYNQGKSCKLLLQRLQALMVANPSQGRYAPTPVKFVWGSDSFGPCLITDLNWTETSWLDGEVASARVNLTLIEIPNDSPTGSQNSQKASSNTSKSLTPRQQQDASTKAKEWLKTNVKKLPDNIASLVRLNKYSLTVVSNGTVTLQDLKKRNLGTVGTLVGTKFITTNNTLIKK
ncbi:hypothetical protein H6G76_35135 [Nostoc sp. FACHB-152]|uniref:CIS tube protein n=1 Tax=Nostoc sp. FACHB-152 TaxID=2692837 RepID=UPI00168854BB|nr:hypothetical protein [Nostoc sp. FACHB-152]MBD2452246.1 hypothetical protein [Nostoc sp. FACHB-152]